MRNGQRQPVQIGGIGTHTAIGRHLTVDNNGPRVILTSVHDAASNRTRLSASMEGTAPFGLRQALRKPSMGGKDHSRIGAEIYAPPNPTPEKVNMIEKKCTCPRSVPQELPRIEVIRLNLQLSQARNRRC